jgi:DNA-binding transcriptional MerR regulator
MGKAELLRERFRQEERLLERLQTANVRFADAQLERLWAIKSTHELGLSIRQIAEAMGVSASRIQQALKANDPHKMPLWATDLRDTGEGKKRKRLAAEVGLLRQCAHWLQRLEEGEEVRVNLRRDMDSETEYVRLDRNGVIRLLEQIAAGLDPETQGHPTEVEGAVHSEQKRRLTEMPKMEPLSTRETRKTVRAKTHLAPA